MRWSQLRLKNASVCKNALFNVHTLTHAFTPIYSRLLALALCALCALALTLLKLRSLQANAVAKGHLRRMHPVIPSRLVAHHINVSMSKRNHKLFANRGGAVIPTEANGQTGRAEAESNHNAAFGVLHTTQHIMSKKMK